MEHESDNDQEKVAYEELIKETKPTKTQRNRHICKICQKPCIGETSLTNHLAKHTNKDIRCNFCRSKFISRSVYQYHMQKTHLQPTKKQKAKNEPVKLQTCSNCDKVFKYPANLQKHNLTPCQKRAATSPCDLCGLKFFDVATHKQEMHDVSVECDVCKRRFASAKSLSHHQKVVHQTEEASFICNTCGKGFFKKLALYYHNRNMHSSQNRKYLCEICCREFKSASHFQLHMLTHDSERKLRKCKVCSQDVPVITFARHQKKHRGLPYIKKRSVCDICGKSVTRPELHKRTHTGEKPYECSFCDKKFASQPLLKTHLVVHTKERPHSCTFCEKSFTQRGPLVKHMKQSHGWKRDGEQK